MIEHCSEVVSVKRRCELLDVARSSMYYQPKPSLNNDPEILNEMRDIQLEHPCYGYRRMLIALRERGFDVNHKLVQRLRNDAGMQAIYPRKNTSVRNIKHKVYPYLLGDLVIDHPNQVWAVDITYIKLRCGYVYLICLIDVFSRKIMGWNLSTFLDAESCIEALENALKNGKPEIINSDQGCQFTSDLWVSRLSAYSIFISMDGKGRWVDNVYIERLWRTIKYENVFLHSYDTVDQARQSLASYIEFYNNRRPHQALNYHTPNAIFELQTIPSKQELFAWFKQQNQPFKEARI
jgi:putative transposase